MKKLKLSPNFVDFKQTIPAGDCFNEEWFFATSNEQISQQVTSDFLQRVTSDFLQRVTSDFLQRATSATSNEQILQRATTDFATSNDQQVNFNK